MASKSMNSVRAKLRISIQFCRGTVERTDRFFKQGSYAPSRKLRSIGFLHGLSDEFEATARSLLDRHETIIRDERSNSDKMSEMISVGSDSSCMVARRK